MPTILPGNDDDIIKEATRVFTRQGLTIRTSSKVTAADLSSKNVILLTVEKDGASEMLEADVVLVSVGRRPLMHGIDATALGLELQQSGAIKVDDQLRTNLPGVYAIGDVAGGKLLAHKAEDEGMIAAEVIAGKKVHMHYAAIPGVVYTWPEIASVGLSEGEVKASGRAYRIGKFPFSANGRARCLGETDGFVKIIADAATDELLGCHILGANAGDLIQEIVLAVEYKGSSEDIAITTHAHPTLGETVKEAALAALGRAIHM
jgi:dihydrolipoamide dehydrogenase